MTDRKRHLYVIGQTGTGKSTYLLNLIDHDLLMGRGIAVIDPHGQLADDTLALVPHARIDDVFYINPTDPNPIAYNPLSDIPLGRRDAVADNIVSSFKHVWPDSWGPQMEWIFVNAVRLALDTGDTFLEVRRLLLDESYRSRLLRQASSPICVSFWRDEFPLYLTRQGDPTTPILNKLGRVLSSPHLRNILCQRRSSLALRQRMDEERLLIVNLNKGQIGEQNAHLLGALLVSGIANAAFSRADIPEEDRAPFYLYADEFQNFATDSFSHVLSEARKYALSLTLSHQFLGQLPEGLKAAVLGNAGSVVSFRVGAEDAAEVAMHLGIGNPDTLQSLPNFKAYARLLKDGAPTSPTYMEMDPPPAASGVNVERLRANASAKFGTPRAKVKARLEAAMAPTKRESKTRQRRWP